MSARNDWSTAELSVDIIDNIRSTRHPIALEGHTPRMTLEPRMMLEE